MSPAAGRVLVVDDDIPIAQVLSTQLRRAGHDVSTFNDGTLALQSYQSIAPDASVVDLWMPHTTGLEVLAGILAQDSAASVILLSGNVDVRTTVRALRAGAQDVQTKPIDRDLLLTGVERGIARSRLMRNHRAAASQIVDPFGLLDDSPAMQRMVRIAERVAQSELPALIVGERGTGRRAVAEMIHNLSSRAGGPFVRIDDAHVQSDELPRHVALAARGTLFLDDIAEFPESTQRILLTLAGNVADITANSLQPRLLVATSRDLLEDTRTDRLRMDLYRKLSVLQVAVPSLRSRGPSAIRTLATRIVHAQRFSLGRGPLRLSESAMSLLDSLEWPGNVRQLRQVLEEALLFGIDSDELQPLHLNTAIERSGVEQNADIVNADERTLAQVERRHIAKILAMTGGHRTEAARILGITRTTLYKKMYDYGLDEVGGA